MMDDMNEILSYVFMDDRYELSDGIVSLRTLTWPPTMEGCSGLSSADILEDVYLVSVT